MDLRHDLQILWNGIGEELDAWYDVYMLSANAQIGFQRGHPEFERFVMDALVPSLLKGEPALEQCVHGIWEEKEPVLKFACYLAARSVWDGLGAPANDVARDLQEQGWTLESLSDTLRRTLIQPLPEKAPGVDYGVMLQ